MLTTVEEQFDSNTIIVGDFNTPLTPMNRSTRHKVKKETEVLNDTLDKWDITDIYRAFHPNTMHFNFFSKTHGKFFSIDHISEPQT